MGYILISILLVNLDYSFRVHLGKASKPLANWGSITLEESHYQAIQPAIYPIFFYSAFPR